MPGIPREVAEHNFNILPGGKPIKQCLNHFDDDKQKTIREEIA